MALVHFYVPELNDQVHIAFVLSVVNLTWLYFFEPWVMETSYLACILHWWCLFKWQQSYNLEFYLHAKIAYWNFVTTRGIVFYKYILFKLLWKVNALNG